MMKSLHDLAPEIQEQILESIFAGNSVPTKGFSWTLQTLLQQLAKDRGDFLAIESKPIALVIWRDLSIEAEILCTFSALEYRGQGCMFKLIKSIFSANSHIANWWLEVHEDNIGALNLYKKLGFQIQGERSRYYPDGGRALIFKHTITS